MKKIVFITGATAGFGEATARLFAANGYHLIITGRRAEKLYALKKELENTHKVPVLTLVFDVRDRKAVFAAVESLPESWRPVDVLVNNAGLALGRDAFHEASIDDWETMIDTNVKGLLYVSKALLPHMINRKRGHVINLGSISGKEVYDKGNVYCASKHAVDAVTKAMRIELLPFNIKVTAINPGAAETEFSLVRFKGNHEAAKKVYEGIEPLTAEDVAAVIFYTTTLPDHVCINDLVLTSLRQANSFYFNRS